MNLWLLCLAFFVVVHHCKINLQCLKGVESMSEIRFDNNLINHTFQPPEEVAYSFASEIFVRQVFLKVWRDLIFSDSKTTKKRVGGGDITFRRQIMIR